MTEQVDSSIECLQSELGYEFQDAELITEALTHSTFANENPGSGAHNERFEFLGDAVLGLLSAEILLEAFPEENEGMLSKRRSRSVSNSALAVWGADLGLGRFMRLGQGQHLADGGVPGSLLADAIEALIGSVYLDGGLESARRIFGNDLKESLICSEARADYKTMLQEFCHRHGEDNPVYSVCDRVGPDHAPTFTCAVSIAGKEMARATGRSKSEAQQESARLTLALREDEENVS